MKKLTVTLLSLCLMSGLAQAQEQKNNDRFAEFKSEMISDLNKEKSILESSISCINAAAKKDDMEKCHEQKRAGMESLRQARDAKQKQRMGERKERLQKELSEIDQKMNQKKPSTQQQN